MKFYDVIAPMYSYLSRLLMPPNKELLKQIQSQKTGNLLDMGCGNGSLISKVSRHRCTGIDSSQTMIHHAVSEEIKKHLVQADARKLPFQQRTFDYVVIAHLLSTAKQPKQILEEAHRVLNPLGICWIQNHDSAGWAWFDYLIAPFSRLIGIQLPFRLLDVVDWNQWELMRTQKIGRFSYFKLITLRRR